MLGADSPLYTPILGLFVLTGFPTARLLPCAARSLSRLTLPATPQSGYLFSKCISAANAESERADKLDGL